MDQPNWRRLSRDLIARRTILGFSNRTRWFEHLGIEADSGPKRTIEDIENGRRDNYRPATLAQVEAWYAWEPGSIEAVLSGQRAVPAAAVDPSDRTALDVARHAEAAAVTADELDAAGRPDAAEELRRFHKAWRDVALSDAVGSNPELAIFTDDELIDEVRSRMTLMAHRLGGFEVDLTDDEVTARRQRVRRSVEREQELSDRRPTVDDLKGLGSVAEPTRQDKGDDEGGADDGEHG